MLINLSKSDYYLKDETIISANFTYYINVHKYYAIVHKYYVSVK
jgi:hypothetical protein